MTMTSAKLTTIREWDAKCTAPEGMMFGTTLDRRRLLEYVDELLAALLDARDDVQECIGREMNPQRQKNRAERLANIDRLLETLPNGGIVNPHLQA